MFSEIFFTFLVTSCIGLLLTISRFCYKSKCKEVDFCCFKIIRDTELEEKIDELNIKSSLESKQNHDDNNV